MCLHLNGQRISHDTIEAKDIIRAVAKRQIDEDDLSDWLRAMASPRERGGPRPALHCAPK